MCGIIAATAQRNVSSILLEGLSKLEYRGYDSAGLCTIEEKISNENITSSKSSIFNCIKTTGKVCNLKTVVNTSGCLGTVGIAHTRWATHGEPNETNAHPHLCEELALVHNGIIENYAEIKDNLLKFGYTFKSQTDTEVLVCLIHYHLHILNDNNKQDTHDIMLKALLFALHEVRGSFGLALLNLNEPSTIYSARSGSPLVIGLGIGENFLASDSLALLPVTNRFVYLDENEVAVIKTNQVQVFDFDGNSKNFEVIESNVDAESLSKGKYSHYMQKEIFEQPLCIQNAISGRITAYNTISLNTIVGLGESEDKSNSDFLKNIEQVQIVACGTSYHAGMIAKYYFENIAKVPTYVDIASEYRYRTTIVRPNSLFVTISQSGETADTLASLRLAKTQGYTKSLSICNVNGSSLVRESDFTILTRAGAEIGVASTKAFTSQLVNLLLLILIIARFKNSVSLEKYNSIISDIKSLPLQVENFLMVDKSINVISEKLCTKDHCLFLGRGSMFPIALEGALKLKEISYIHAEGYAAGELKHGPIALIDKNMPVVVVAPDNNLLEKLISNIEEVRARGARLFVFTSEGNETSFYKGELGKRITVIPLPQCSEILQPLLYSIPLQLLAYHCAVLKGNDVDQPRNLAKSVTVE